MYNNYKKHAYSHGGGIRLSIALQISRAKPGNRREEGMEGGKDEGRERGMERVRVLQREGGEGRKVSRLRGREGG